MMKTGETIVNTECVSNGKIILNQNIPIEELLGSVTTINNIEGSESKLRTSARVFKKMKLDSANAALPAPPPVPDKKELIKEEVKQEVKKTFRPLWSTEDKNLFFEALNEYGRDFEAIHSYISNKLKRKSVPEHMIKSKDQIRLLYHRTFQKISKHLKFSDEIKKTAQELYTLINYGELRRKIGSVTEKTSIKLNELIYRGTVAIRLKGKTIRVRTPNCRALRKLNQIDENHDHIKLPAKICVELKAKDINSWMRVQTVAQNPRVKTSLPLQKRVSSLIIYLSNRWKTQTASAYDECIATANDITSDCLPEAKIIAENKELLNPPLRLSPSSDCNIQIPTINLSEYLTSQSICLNAYEKRFGVTVPGESLWLAAYKSSSSKSGSRKGGIKRSRNESTGEIKSPQKVNGTGCNNVENNENFLNDGDLPPSVSEVVDEAVNTILALKNLEAQLGSEEKIIESTPDVKPLIEKTDNETKKEKELAIAKIRNGWTLYNCGALSIGELYLMFGSDAKLTLEYNWDCLESNSEEKCDVEVKEKNDECNSTESIIQEQKEDSKDDIKTIDDNHNDVTAVLKRLLSVAKLHYRKNIVKCPCGHICGVPKNRNKCTSKTGKSQDGQEKPQDSAGDTTIAVTVTPVPIQPRITPATLFQRPRSPNSNLLLKAQLESLQKFRPFCNRRGRRPRSKQVVVERRLPLLANKGESGHQIVQMNIISKTTQRTIAPKVITSLSENNFVLNGSVLNINENGANFVVSSSSTTDNNSGGGNCMLPLDISDNAVTPSRVCSPTGISNLLEMALTSQNDADNKQDSSMPTFEGLLAEPIPNSTPPASPCTLLKENENQWINAEVADFSLSSFLGHLESPVKQTQSSLSIAGDDTRMSQDVDAQLQSLLTENSIDYTAKFADLAAQVISDLKK